MRLHIFLIVLLVLFALGTVTAQHRARTLYSGLEAGRQYSNRLELEFQNLERDQAMLSTQPSIEQVAREKLQMFIPGTQNNVVGSGKQPPSQGRGR